MIDIFFKVLCHGGNDFRTLIQDLISDYLDMFIAPMDWFKMLDFSQYFDGPSDHAGEMEITVMQFYHPELVDSLDKVGDGNAKTFKIDAMKKGRVSTPRDWNRVTNDTEVGDPSKAFPEKAERMFNVPVPVISDFLIELSKKEIDDVYE